MSRQQTPRQWVPAITAREGNLASTKNETWAYYTLAPQYVADLSTQGLDDLIRDCADRIGDLQGSAVWLRATTVPFPCAEYSVRLGKPIGSFPVEAAAGAVTRDDIIDAAAWFPADGAVEVVDGVVTRRLDSRWPVVVIGVRIAKSPLEECDMRRILADEPPPESRSAVVAVHSRYRDVTNAVARAGWSASPVSNDAFSWLYDASLALGHNVDMPAAGEASPLAYAHIRTVQDPDGVTVPVRVDIDGDVTVRHARIMRLSTWHERDTAVLPPWLAWALAQPYRVDIAVRFDVQPPEKSIESMRRAVHRNAGIVEHMETYKRPISGKLRQALRRGPQAIDDMESGVASVASQIDTRVVFAVSGDTPQEAVDLAKTFKAAASRGRGDTDARGPGLVLESAPAQWAEWRCFVPGEPWPMHGHQQRQSPLMLAAGVPHASHRAGDDTGATLGAIAGSTDFYLLDFFGGHRRNKAGLLGFLGDQGSGKSSMLAYAAWWMALVDQAPVTILDPSRRITDQLRVPELWPHLREARLDMNGAPGTLASHFLSPDPRRSMFDTDEDHAAALVAAQTERIEFAIDAARYALPSMSMAGDPDVIECLRAAVTDAGGEYGVQPSEIIAAIENDGEFGARLAKQIRSYSLLSGGRLLWQDRRPGDTYVSGGDDLVTVMSVAGVRPPKSGDPATWDTQQARSVMLLAGAAQLASAHVWRDRSAKGLCIDEATTLLSGTSAMQGLMQRGALDSRKVTCAFLVAMHLTGSLESVGAHADAMFGAAAIMRTERENAAAALSMLRTQPGRGWEDLAPTLRNGEMIMSGWDGRVVHTRFDQAVLPDEFRRQLSTSTLDETPRLRTLFGAGA